jgi:hypothetical protein
MYWRRRALFNVSVLSSLIITINASDFIILYRVSQEECASLREGVPYVKVYRYNPKHLYPKLNGYGDNGYRKVWSSLGFHALYLSADSLINFRP